MSKRCQIVMKKSNVKKSNSWTKDDVHKKTKLDTMRFTHNDVNFDVTYDKSSKLVKNISYEHFEDF